MKSNGRFFKVIVLTLACVSLLCSGGCSEEESSYSDGETSYSQEEVSSWEEKASDAEEDRGQSSSVKEEFCWEKAGKGSGAYIPEPTWEYVIKASSTYISAEVHNITESDFYAYANACIDLGFDGKIGSATTPDLYLMAYNAERYYIQLSYYKNENYFSIYISPPKKN